MNGKRMEQDFHIIGSDGVSRPFRSTIARLGPDRCDWTVLTREDGAWTEMFSLHYARSGN